MRATMARNLANRYGSVLLFSPRLGRLGRVATWGTDFVRLRVTVSRLLWRSCVLCCVRLRVCFYRQGEWGSVSSRRLPPPWFLVQSNSSTSIGHFPKDVIVNAFAVSIQPMVRPD